MISKASCLKIRFLRFMITLMVVLVNLTGFLLYSICLGLSIDEYSRKKLDVTAEELTEEKALAYSCLS